MTRFNDLALAEPLARALSTLGYTEPTPIQSEAIPHLLGGRDLLGIAQTGTGKTAAFALPALHHVFTREMDPPKRGARVLILAPTRELVGQIHESVVSYGRFMMPLSTQKITGGVSIGAQIKRIVNGNDVLVATPGRLIDLLDRKAITLKDVEMLILDEADQMMDMGFIHALKKIVPLLPKTRQTVLLSATLPPKIKSLAKQFLTDPVQVSVTPPNSTAEKVVQSLIFAKPVEKPMLLADYLLQPEVERALVFTRTKHGADRVVKRLAAVGFPALAIHGNKSQGQRQRALGAFKDGIVDILVATDVAARGIDIPGITHVFNYEIPNVPEQYVHRIGRTARAQASGTAVAFVAPDERAYLKDIQKLLKETIPVQPMPEDMPARIKVINAREAAAPVSIASEQPRKGRGKSRKKSGRPSGEGRAEQSEGRSGVNRWKDKPKDRRRGKKANRPPEGHVNPSDTPREQRRNPEVSSSQFVPAETRAQTESAKPKHKKKKTRSSFDSQKPTHSRKSRAGQSGERASEGGSKERARKKPERDGEARRKAAPKRKPQSAGASRGGPSRSGPQANGKSAKPSKGGNAASRSRKAPTRNSGGQQSPKRRKG